MSQKLDLYYTQCQLIAKIPEIESEEEREQIGMLMMKNFYEAIKRD